MKKILLEDVINIFFKYTIYDLKEEIETPNINFRFKEKLDDLFDQKDLDYLINNSECLYVVINDKLTFLNI